MDRRSFIRNATAVAGVLSATSAMAAPAIAQGLKEIRMVTTWPRGFAGLGSAAQRIADRITLISGGRMKVQLFAADEMAPAFGVFDAVSTGKAEMYHGAEYYWDKKHKAYPFFTTVPLGMTAHEIEAWVHFGGGQELWDELAAQFGLKCFLAANTGVQMGGWYQTPITTLEEIKNLKIRMPGLGAEVIRRLGGEAIAIPAGEILEALKSGKINAAEWIGPWNDREFGLHRVLKNYMFPGFHEPGTALSLGINKKFWDSLKKDEQEIIKASCSAENSIMIAEFNARNGEALADLLTNHGVKLHIYPKPVWAEIARVSRDVVNEIGATDDISRRILQSWTDFQKSVSEWQQISDISYIAYRSLTSRR